MCASTSPSQTQFPCERCGAIQNYAPGTKSLVCGYCGHANAIEDAGVAIREHSFREALSALQTEPSAQQPTIQCTNCGAQFSFEENIHAGQCPFCGVAVVVGTGETRPIKPESLLPFKVTEAEARERFGRWLKGLWFAPAALRKQAGGHTRLVGVYLPYWTYDSFTSTQYKGQRGDYYYVRQTYTTVENGRSVRRARAVRKVRWHPARGTVSRHFDDVLVGASQSLPRKITQRLEPWDLENLVPYNEQYLSGFHSEIYQVRLDEGFDHAVKIMDRTIRRDVAADIGGDVQRIDYIDTRHSKTTFKHLLLPIWSAAFRFKGKLHRFVVNGRSGKVQGERPYSHWKIAVAVGTGIALLAALLVALYEAGVLDEVFTELLYQLYLESGGY